MTSELDELIEVERFRAGDPDVFEQVVRTYYDRVYRLALRMLGTPGDAEDAAQEVFLRIHRRASRFHGRSALSTWIYRVAHNICLDEIRKRKRRPVGTISHGEDFDMAANIPDTQSGPEAIVTALDESAEIRHALKTLPQEYQSVLILREIEELTYDEIAAVLGCPVGTVRSRLARGRRLLAEHLERRGAHDMQRRTRSAATV